MPEMTPAQRVSKHKDFLNANWKAIASFAYGEFLSKGRGMVVVPEADFVFAERPRLAPIHFRYVSKADAETLLDDWNGSKDQGWIETYDPKEKVILVIVRFDSGVSSYLIGSRPTPPEAFRLAKAGEN